MTTPPVPTDFPIPPDIEGFWAWEKGHFPRPATPLTQEILYRGPYRRLLQGDGGLGLSFWRRMSCHQLLRLPRTSAPSTWALKRWRTGAHAIRRYSARSCRAWATCGRRNGCPPSSPASQKGRTADYTTLSNAELLHTLDEMLQDFRERWTLHGYINFVVISASWFADFYNETFEPEDPLEPYLLLQGFPTRSLDAGRGLWRLSRIIKNSPALKRLFEEQEPTQLVSQLERSDEGRNFLREFRAYLDEFGWRSEAFELADPTWRENPTVPLNTLQGYISLDEGANPDVRFHEAVQTRERLVGQARQRLAGDPEKLARFNELYDMGRHNLVLTDDHNYYIDQVGDAILRSLLLEIGRRLVRQGALADDERRVPALPGRDTRRPGGSEPTEPGGATAGRNGSVVEDHSTASDRRTATTQRRPLGGGVLRKMLGVPPEPSQDPDVITGTGASPGTVQGRAKVVRSLSEASKVQPGEILVCEMTMPAWTSLFSTVSAVVSDTGGVLSHCAIVSREYRIPCVVGTVVGTSVIKDGMLLTVDGSQGMVRIEARV